MNWLDLNKSTANIIIGIRTFLWDTERETATVGTIESDPDHGLIVSAYNDYFELNCFSHFAYIEHP